LSDFEREYKRFWDLLILIVCLFLGIVYWLGMKVEGGVVWFLSVRPIQTLQFLLPSTIPTLLEIQKTH